MYHEAIAESEHLSQALTIYQCHTLCHKLFILLNQTNFILNQNLKQVTHLFIIYAINGRVIGHECISLNVESIERL